MTKILIYKAFLCCLGLVLQKPNSALAFLEFSRFNLSEYYVEPWCLIIVVQSKLHLPNFN